MFEIFPLILCGGSGTRLWPLSRKSYPKQFVKLIGEHSLYQQCATRMTGTQGAVKFAAPTILTGSDFRFVVTEQLQDLGVDPGAILIEPEGRNTAPAVLAAALHIAKTSPDALLLVAPSDHILPDSTAFSEALAKAAEAALSGELVTFGITPDRAETGYGYLKLLEKSADNGACKLESFVEKPDLEDAKRMVADGSYLWNAGIFLFTAQDIIAAFEQHAPESVVVPVKEAVEQGKPDLGFFRLAEEPWESVQDISIDYAVMEKADNLSAVPFHGSWSDLGSWSTVREQSGLDVDGVATSGQVTTIDCKNSLLRSEHPDLELVGLGLDGIVAIAMPDAVLVADSSRTQDVKLAVKSLAAKGARQAESLPIDHRPWGHFETLVLGDRFQVKRIVVKPGASLSLQSHHHRSEHWIVVQGTAKVTIDDTIKLVTENESVYIPLGAVHRMENPGKVDMVLIEVQTGSYLGEDDIIRYEDVYSRGQGAKG
ncbi:mannose-1-phosphate guanylyltransferase/mannose-6-phosphate isomerase [Nioella aestuarii]|uniref:mannose-1-phosphate guanylyltransferase/mannose-6-phosphate isomerase n=1 Tax=Nioella aestuarii TaxID=1662864 RepID=UPI003D7F550B